MLTANLGEKELLHCIKVTRSYFFNVIVIHQITLNLYLNNPAIKILLV